MAAVHQQRLKIDRFLASQMTLNTKTKEEIHTLRGTECARVNIQGDNTEMLTIEGLEDRFQQQQNGASRVSIPSTDILEWKSSFPLIETCNQALESMKSEYDDIFKQGEEKIIQKEAEIDEELYSMIEGQNAKETAKKIAGIVENAVIIGGPASPDSPVKRKLLREIEEALITNEGFDTALNQISFERKTRIIGVLRNILHEGIDNSLRKVKKWGHILNRRGQIGENRTMAAINQALEGLMGISVMGMKTHSYLLDFLERLNISLTYHNTRDPATGRVIKANEVEHDAIITWAESDVLVLTIVESKTKEFKPWAPSDIAERSAAAIKHATHALKQVLKDFTTFKEIFLDIPKTMMEKIRFQYYVSLSDVSCEDWPSGTAADHILFKEDIENIGKLQSKLKIPDSPPNLDSISPDIKHLNTVIGARYVGGASLISLKNPKEGFSRQGEMMKKIRTGFEGQSEKVFMMGIEQQALFQSGLCNYSNFGGHGSGKTVLLHSNILRDAQKIVADQDSGSQHLMILCVWQKGANALLSQYRELESSLPEADNLETMVVTKEELMARFHATVQENEATTNQINTVCQNIDALSGDKQVHLYIDEVWVTVPKTFSPHMTAAHPDEVVGHIPFLRNGELYPWSKLDPGQVELSVAVMPDCQHLLEKDLITASPPDQGPVLTVFAPRSFRTTMRVHHLVQYIQGRVEMDLRVWRYLLPPKDEKDGHEIMGSLPVWQPVKQTDHFICQTDDCEQCYLKNISMPLMSHYSDAVNIHGAMPEDIVFILSRATPSVGGLGPPDAFLAMQYLRQKFGQQVEVKFDDQFEGMEKPVVFNLTNGSLGTSPSIIPVSLTRANSHLVVFIADFRNILKDATDKGLVRMSKYDIPTTTADTDEALIPLDVLEAKDVLCCLSRTIPMEAIHLLAQEWSTETLYSQLLDQEKSRFQMIEIMCQKYMEENPTVTMAQFMDKLRAVNMVEVVTEKMADNLNSNVILLQEMIMAKNLSAEEQVELAHSLGQRTLFNSMTQPQDPSVVAVSDQDALQRCIQTAEVSNTSELIKCLRKAGLSRIAYEIKNRMDQTMADFDIESFHNMSLGEAIGFTAFDVFLPLITAILTVAYLVVLYSNNQNSQFWVLLLLQWNPSAILYSMHLFSNHKFFGSSTKSPKMHMLVMLIFYPLGSIFLHVIYLLKRANYIGIEIERYKMKKILRLAETSVMMNNFTSMMVVIFTIHLANTGIISYENPALLSFSSVTLALHLMKLFFNLLKLQRSQNLSTGVAVTSSFILKVVSLTILFCSDCSYKILFGCVMFVLGLVVNYRLEKRFLADETDEEEKITFLRAAHSLIFPLAPKVQTKKQVFGVRLQLLVGNIAAVTLGFSVCLIVGVTEGLFITQNMVKAFFLPVVCLSVYSTLAHYGISIFAQPVSTGDLEGDIEDPSESTPLLGIPNTPKPKSSIKKAATSLALLLVLFLILASWYPLLLYQFNTCPSFSLTPNAIITCNTNPQTYGSTCHLSCSPMFFSGESLQSFCTFTGVWNVTDLSCRPQVAAIIGRGGNITRQKWVQATDIYPPTDGIYHLPGLPLELGSAAYIDGGVIFCGGSNIHDATELALKTCNFLKHPTPQWMLTFPLLQATKTPATAVIEDGRAMLVMGGLGTDNHVLSTTQIVRPGKPTQYGPQMREMVKGACATTLQDGSVIVTGGGRSGNHGGSARAEIYNFTTGLWRPVQEMREKRVFHSCTQVWLTPDDPDDAEFIGGLVSNTSVLSIVVAGGVNLHYGFFYNPLKSVEVYLPWNDTWMDLPNLPTWTVEDGTAYQATLTHIMSLAITGDTNKLHLIGGACMDWNTQAEGIVGTVWRQAFNSRNETFFWEQRFDPETDLYMSGLFSTAVGVPDTFFASFCF